MRFTDLMLFYNRDIYYKGKLVQSCRCEGYMCIERMILSSLSLSS
jgi:hypothetical protein